MQVGAVFGVTHTTVQNLQKGLTSCKDGKYDEDLAEKVKAQRIKTAHEQALDAMVNSLSRLNQTLPGVTNARDLSRIAVDMSKINSSFASTDRTVGVISNTQVVLFAPKQKAENQYEVLEA